MITAKELRCILKKPAGSLTSADLSELQPKHVEMLSPRHIHGLSSRVLLGMTAKQIGALTQEQVAVLSLEKMGLVPPSVREKRQRAVVREIDGIADLERKLDAQIMSAQFSLALIFAMILPAVAIAHKLRLI